MTKKVLGKIDFAEYGTVKDYPFMIGLQLGFKLGNSGGVGDGGKYTINISKTCRWDESDRQEAITKKADELYEILKDAKVNYVSQLVGKPVEVEIEDNMFKDFRILTEVL